MRSGIKLVSEVLGQGREAVRGDTVTVCYDLFLNRGGQVRTHETITFTIGRRVVVAGLEYGVEGMRVGGRRRFRVGPHLGYGERGVPNLIPANAVLIFDVELIGLEAET